MEQVEKIIKSTTEHILRAGKFALIIGYYFYNGNCMICFLFVFRKMNSGMRTFEGLKFLKHCNYFNLIESMHN